MASTFLSDMYAALSSTAEADAVVRLFLRRERNISAYDARTFIDDPNMQGLPPQAVLLLNAFFFGAQGGPPSDADAARFVTDVAAKVAAADPKQLQQLPRKIVLSLCRALARSAERVRRLPEALAPMAKFIALDPSSLTPLQPLFLGCCLKAQCSEQAREVAGAPIYDADHAKELGLTPLEALQHFYYAGVIFVHLRDWTQAAEAFRLCMLVPAEAISALSINAHRRWLLTSVLATGAFPALPKSLSAIVARNVEKSAMSQVFVRLAKACCSSSEQRLDAAAIDRCFNEGQQAGAWGPAAKDAVITLLANEVVLSAARRRVLRLSQTYTTVPFSEVAAAAGAGRTAADAVAMCEALIAQGQMPGARVDRVAGMLSFVGGAEAGVGAGAAGSGAGTRAAALAKENAARLQRVVEELQQAVRRLQRADAELSLQLPVLRRQLLAQQQAGSEEGGGGADSSRSRSHGAVHGMRATGGGGGGTGGGSLGGGGALSDMGLYTGQELDLEALGDVDEESMAAILDALGQ